MKTLSATEARSKLASCLDEVESGQELFITRQGHEDVALISAELLYGLKASSEMMKEVKVKLFDAIVSKSPDEVNALHDVLCIITDAPRITNPEIIKAIDEMEKGQGKSWVMPKPKG